MDTEGGDSAVSEEFIVRRATMQDIEALARLRVAMAREIRHDGPGADVMLQATRRYLHRAMPAGEYRSWIGEVEGEVVATMGLFIFERPPLSSTAATREGRITAVYTAPEWRRRGVATALLAAVLEHVRQEEGLGRVRLAARAEARAIYEEAGFAPVDNELQLLL